MAFGFLFGSSINENNLDENSTYCTTYIPEIKEYYEALGWIWILFVIIGCAACILLYGLFVELVASAFQNVHVVYRNSVIWISSVYPFMTLMTIIGFIIPRSQKVCFTVKVLYMMIGISKFADFTVLLYGSEEVMLWKLKDSKLRLRVGPICCCCCFLPHLRVTKRRLSLIAAGIRQLPFTQSFFMISVMILQSANQVVVGSLNPKGSYVWLNLINMITTLTGVYCLNLFSCISYEHLHRYSYSKLSFVMKTLIIITKMQSFLFNTMAYYEIFPCVPPISHVVYKQTVENYFYIVEMLTFGVYSYKLYSRAPLESANPTVIRTDSRGNTLPHHAAYLPSMSSYVQEHGYGFPGNDFLDNTNLFEEERIDSEILADAYRATYDFSGSTLVIESEEPPTNSRGYQRFE